MCDCIKTAKKCKKYSIAVAFASNYNTITKEQEADKEMDDEVEQLCLPPHQRRQQIIKERTST